MLGLLGRRDELLRIVQDAFPVTINVRGNEITFVGDEHEVRIVAELFEEMVVLLERGHDLDRESVVRSIAMVRADQRPTEVLGTEVLRGRRSVGPKTAGQKRYVDAVRANTVTFANRTGRHRKELSGSCVGGPGTPGEGSESDHPHAPRRGGRREPGISSG